VQAGVLADHGGWRVAVTGVGLGALACAVACALVLPPSAFFTPAPPRLRALAATLRRNIADASLLRLYVIGFTLMGAFVTVYNYLTFRLSAAPFGLPASAIGALFTVYLAGTYSSPAAGRLADRAGRRVVLVLGVLVTLAGVALTLPASLPLIVAGLVMMTAGFFAAHSVASGWVGARAPVAPAQASALYLCLYYVGSSVVCSTPAAAGPPPWPSWRSCSRPPWPARPHCAESAGSGTRLSGAGDPAQSPDECRHLPLRRHRMLSEMLPQGNPGGKVFGEVRDAIRQCV